MKENDNIYVDAARELLEAWQTFIAPAKEAAGNLKNKVVETMEKLRRNGKRDRRWLRPRPCMVDEWDALPSDHLYEQAQAGIARPGGEPEKEESKDA